MLVGWHSHSDSFVDLANISSPVIRLGRNCRVLSLFGFVLEMHPEVRCKHGLDILSYRWQLSERTTIRRIHTQKGSDMRIRGEFCAIQFVRTEASINALMRTAWPISKEKSHDQWCIECSSVHWQVANTCCEMRAVGFRVLIFMIQYAVLLGIWL